MAASVMDCVTMNGNFPVLPEELKEKPCKNNSMLLLLTLLQWGHSLSVSWLETEKTSA